MKALGKILGLLILGLLVIIVGLGFALTQYFDPNDYKADIQRLAKEQAGLELTINGDIGWSIFPWLGLKLNDTQLASLKTPEQPFASVSQLGLAVQVMPLLQREIRMSDINVDKLKLDLIRFKDGQTNWAGVGESTVADAETQAPKTGTSADTPEDPAAEGTETHDGSKLLELDIDSLNITDASIRYRDDETAQQLTLDSLYLTATGIRENTPIPVTLMVRINNGSPALQVRTELQTQLLFDTRQQRYQLQNLNLSGEASGDPLHDKTLQFSAAGNLLADLANATGEWQNLQLTLNQMQASGTLTVADLLKNPKLAGTLNIASFSPRELLTGLGVTLPASSDPKALSSLDLSTRLSASAESLNLEDLNINLDGSNIKGRVAVTDFASQALQASLSGNTFDVDRYLPPADEAQKQATSTRKSEVETGSINSDLPEKPTDNPWSTDPVLPLEALRDLNTELSLNFSQLRISQLPIDEFGMKTQTRKGLLQLKELRGQVFGGQVNASGQLDARSETPKLQFKTSTANVPLEQVLKSQGKEDILHGALDLNAAFTARGNSQKAWMDTLGGDGQFTINNGELVDATIDQQLCAAIAKVRGETISSPLQRTNTPFNALTGTLKVSNGLANTPNLRIEIPGLKVKGSGDVDLRVLAMDYRLGITVGGDKGAMPDEACQINDRYNNIEWPLRCRGPVELGAKACRLDKERIGDLAQQALKSKAQTKLNEKIEEKLGDKVSPELRDKLKGLFQ